MKKRKLLTCVGALDRLAIASHHTATAAWACGMWPARWASRAGDVWWGDCQRFAIVQLVNCRAVTIPLSIMRYEVTDDPKEFAKQLFKAGQQPAAWLRSAGHLRDAAEVILKHEL
jgi:hypothetical protein